MYMYLVLFPTRVMTSRGTPVADGELVIDRFEDDNEDQKWLFRRARGVIQNGDERDSVLDIADCSEEPGAKVIAWEENGQDNQQWECERVYVT